MVLGAGKIGSLVAMLLSEKYQVTLADLKLPTSANSKIRCVQLDASNHLKLESALDEFRVSTVVTCLPHFMTKDVAKLVIKKNINYFDLTEDVDTTNFTKELSKNVESLVVPQCGLAPGIVSIIAQDLIKKFDEVDKVKMRVGALPLHVSNALHYALTWSIDGLINEYIQDSSVLRNKTLIKMPGLSGLETLKIDGLTYEAFHTSGGVGSLVETYAGKINIMDYKTIRYPGHCEKMHFLLKQLHLEDKPDLIKQILENVIPQTNQDMVLIYVSVSGGFMGNFIEHHYVQKFYSTTLYGRSWNAIQSCTASSACSVIDYLLNSNKSGLIKQEDIPFSELIKNSYGRMFSVNLESLNVT